MSGIGTRRGALQLARRVLRRVLLLAGFVVTGWLVGATVAAADTGPGVVQAEPTVLDGRLAPVVADVSTAMPARAPALPGTGRVPAAAEDTAAVVEQGAAVTGHTVSEVAAVVEDTVERTVGAVKDALAPVGQVLPVSRAPAPAPVEPPPQELLQLEYVTGPAPPAPHPMSDVTLPAPLPATAAAPAGQPASPSVDGYAPTLPVPVAPPCSGVPAGSPTAGGSASGTTPSAVTGVPCGADGDQLGAGTVGAARWRTERPSTSPD